MAKKKLPPVPLLSQKCLEDDQWADQHFTEIVKKYPNKWVAVVGKRVVASGDTIAEVKRIAKKKTGQQEFPILFAERGIHVYQNLSRFQK